jgi:hypothetical protein
MNEDYLWDKSGEPDPEIQRLEQILGTLRYQEKPLELPEQITHHRSHNHVFLLAIAATVLLGLLVASRGLKARNNHSPEKQIAGAPETISTPSPKNDESASPSGLEVPEQRSVKNTTVEHRPHLAKASVPKKPVLTTKEREEALAAKQQVMLALRLASEKLNEVQRRSVVPTPPVKNQHKAG